MLIPPSKFLATPLAWAAVLSIAGCSLINDPPTQLEARLDLTGQSVENPKDLARQFVAQLGIEGLKPEHVRVVHDKEKKAHFFRVVGKQALSPELLKQVSAGLAGLNERYSLQGKLEVSADSDFDAFLKTSKREFPIRASWHKAQVQVYLVQSALERMLGSAMAGQGTPPRRVACMLGFEPQEPLPVLEGDVNKMFPDGKGGFTVLRPAGTSPREMTLPHEVKITHPELSKLEAPVVLDGRVQFQFALILDANVTVIGGSSADSKPSVIDHGTITRCREKLIEVAPKVRQLIDDAALLDEVRSIGPAQLMALPKQ